MCLYRQGWRKDSLKPGEEIEVEGFQAKDGSANAWTRSVKTADGRRMFAGTPDALPPGAPPAPDKRTTNRPEMRIRLVISIAAAAGRDWRGTGLAQASAQAAYKAPRTADGSPDLQGIWQVRNTSAAFDRGRPRGRARDSSGKKRRSWIRRMARFPTSRKRWPNGRRISRIGTPPTH